MQLGRQTGWIMMLFLKLTPQWKMPHPILKAGLLAKSYAQQCRAAQTHKPTHKHFLKAQQNNTTCSCLILSSADTHCGACSRRSQCTDKKQSLYTSLWILCTASDAALLYCMSPGVKGIWIKEKEERQKWESDGAALSWNEALFAVAVFFRGFPFISWCWSLLPLLYLNQ